MAGISKLIQYGKALLKSSEGLEDIKVLLGRQRMAQLATLPSDAPFNAYEEKVFSQYGEDGLIQYLVKATEITPAEERFVEFGVEDYTESNTRFLLLNNNWAGLVLDGAAGHIRSLESQRLMWRHTLVARQAFVTAENILGLIQKEGFDQNLGLLSIDIDGNDYWIWKALDALKPVIVVIEYNSLFGAERAITVPYHPAFTRSNAHHSSLYFGASLPALSYLAQQKGYTLVGGNRQGNNAFFVRNDRLNSLQPCSIQDAYRESRFRESRDTHGKLTFIHGPARYELIRGLPVVNVVSGKEEVL